MATPVDGIQGQTNRKDTVEMVYLPIIMGYQNCCKQYMASLDRHVRCKPDVAVIVEGKLGSSKPVDEGYVPSSTYREYMIYKNSQFQLMKRLELFINRYRLVFFSQ